MDNNRLTDQNAWLGHSGACLTALILAISSLGLSAQGNLSSEEGAKNSLNPGDILYADSGNAIDGGFIIKIDAATHRQTVISSGGYLNMPFDLVLGRDGGIIVSDTAGRLIQVDPGTGDQSLIMDNSGGLLGMPCGLALDRQGDVLLANTRSLIRVHPETGQTGAVSTGQNFYLPLGVAMSDSGEVYVLNRAFPNQILWVNSANGFQTVVSQGGYLNNPQAIAFHGNSIYVTDVAGGDGNFGVGRVIRIDARSGAQSILSEGKLLVGPVGITAAENGELIIGDPYTVNCASPDLYDGAIIRVDPINGAQTLVARGEGAFLNPRGVAVVSARDANQNLRSVR